MRRLRAVAGALVGIMTLWMAGCRSAQMPDVPKTPSGSRATDEGNGARWAAEADLGKQAEILLQGDLALNGREQLFVVNRLRLPKSLAQSDGKTRPAPVFITRAAILEKEGSKWSEKLRCDEHVKNPSGYLGGIPADSVAGWRIEYHLNSEHGLELKFSPAAVYLPKDYKPAQNFEVKNGTFEVRWNKNTKRYQSYDQSHERYLSEVPSLETPQSILK